MELADTQYKESEIGLIPVDWEIDLVKNLTIISTGAKNTQDRVEDGTYPFFVRSQNVERINSYSYDGEAVLTAGDGVGTGKVHHYINGKFDYHQRVYKISDFCERINGYYFYLYFSNKFLARIMSMTAKSSVDSVRMDMIANMVVPIPPKPEQTAIATALSDIDAFIENLEKLIAKKRNIKQGVMQELLTGKKRLTGFKGDWIVKKLGEIGELTGAGVDKKIRPDETPVRLVNYLDVFHKDFIYSKNLNHWVTAPLKQAKRCEVKKGDIFFTPSSEMQFDIAISAIAMEDIEDAAYSYHIIRMRLFEDWDLIFRAYIFKTKQFLSIAERTCEGSGKRYVISLSKFREMEITYPPDKNEQRAISDILYSIDSEIETLEHKLYKYKMIKQGMMQALLTGKIRLV